MPAILIGGGGEGKEDICQEGARGRRTEFFETKPQRTQRTQRERTTGTRACSCGRPRLATRQTCAHHHWRWFPGFPLRSLRSLRLIKLLRRLRIVQTKST